MNPSAITPPDCPRERYLAALRHWSFHVTVSAAPSFVFAASVGWRAPESICGMLLGVAFFIALYTALARWTFPREAGGALWRRALRLGTWIRTVWAGLVFLSLIASPRFLASVTGGPWLGYLFVPDMFAGVYAHAAVRWFALLPPVRDVRIFLTGPEPAVRNLDPWVGNIGSFWPTFLLTVVEGFILSAALFLIAFACLGVLRLASRRWPRLERIRNGPETL